MAQIDKIKEKVSNHSKSVTWQEVKKLFKSCGYEERKGKGSRRKFVNKKTKSIISLHEPHPQKELKQYAVKEIKEHLNL